MVQQCRPLMFYPTEGKVTKILNSVSQQVNYNCLETVTMRHETCELLCLESQKLNMLENAEIHRLLGS